MFIKKAEPTNVKEGAVLSPLVALIGWAIHQKLGLDVPSLIIGLSICTALGVGVFALKKLGESEDRQNEFNDDLLKHAKSLQHEQWKNFLLILEVLGPKTAQFRAAL